MSSGGKNMELHLDTTLENRSIWATSKLLIVAEIVIVFLPLYAALLLSDRMGIDHIRIGDGLVILGGWMSYAGLVLSTALFCMFSRLRGAGLADYGLVRPKNWLVTILVALGVAFAILGSVVLVINPIIEAMPNLEPRDMSRFEHLKGNLPTLILNIILMWVTAGFIEEFMWRGYLLNRLIALIGRPTKSAGLLAIVLSAVIFGLCHSYQGSVGMIKTGAIGLVFGFAFLAVKRRLWPLMLAHALIDSFDFISHYFNG